MPVADFDEEISKMDPKYEEKDKQTLSFLLESVKALITNLCANKNVVGKHFFLIF